MPKFFDSLYLHLYTERPPTRFQACTCIQDRPCCALLIQCCQKCRQSRSVCRKVCVLIPHYCASSHMEKLSFQLLYCVLCGWLIRVPNVLKMIRTRRDD